MAVDDVRADADVNAVIGGCNPGNPRGRNFAVCVSCVPPPDASGVTVKSSTATPGTRISARSVSRCSGISSLTRQNPTVLPTGAAPHAAACASTRVHQPDGRERRAPTTAGCSETTPGHRPRSVERRTPSLVRRRFAARADRRRRHRPPNRDPRASGRQTTTYFRHRRGPRRRARARSPQLSIPVGVAGAGGLHRMHQVVRGVTPAELGRQRLRVVQIGGTHVDVRMMTPRPVVQLPRRSHETADRVARIEQARHQSRSDVARRSGGRQWS
jgi:hypothetical protein